MNKKILLTGAIIGASALMVSCGSSSSGGGSKSSLAKFIADFDQEPGVAACGNIGKLLSEDTLSVEGDDKAQCTLPARIGVDTTLTDDVIWIATAKTKVGFGDFEIEAGDKKVLQDNSVTLTIEEGTEIRSTSGGALVITRGSQIDAQGTSDDPIIMSSLEQNDGEEIDEDYVGSGEWGGLVIQGFGKHNKCPNSSKDEICNILGEGDVGYFGGNDNADNSGSVKYVIVTEGGVEVAPDNEINGITFQGVGSGTTVDYIQVHENADDGVEFFGGAVNVSHMLLTYNEDDSIDWDEGYQGNIQYAYIFIDSSAGNAFETDNNGSSMDANPRSMPTLANITIDSNGAEGVRHREGTGVFVFNSVYYGLDYCLDVDDSATHDLVDTSLIYTNVYFDCDDNTKGEVENAGDDFAESVVDSSVSSVNTAGVTWDGYAINEGQSISAPSFAAATTADTSFLDATTYVGAVKDGETEWWSGWALEWD